MKNQFRSRRFVALTIFFLVVPVAFLQAQSDQISGEKQATDISGLSVNNVFATVVSNRKAPRIVDTLETLVETGDIAVQKIHFESVVDSAWTNRIFAYLIHPNNKSNLPAVLILHGGTQTADDYYKLGLQFAQRGYAVLIPDLPGITSPGPAARNGNGSSGNWADQPYGKNHFLVSPTVRASSIYEGVVTALQAFYLLKSQSFVDSNSMGIRGLSWGGYATIMTTALLGSQVKAGFAVYGSGFYDLPSYFKAIVDKLDKPSRQTWLSSLDAGRYAALIQAPFYFMAASNDNYFRPPAVEATYNQIKGTKYLLFSPNNDHSLSNTIDPKATEFAFFDFYLRRQGAELPPITLTGNRLAADGSLLINYEVKTKLPVTETRLWYSPAGGDWMKRTWQAVVPMNVGQNRYQATLPNLSAGSTLNWYVTVTDVRNVSIGTQIH